MHEQNGGERPDSWAAWTSPAGQGDEADSGRQAAPAPAGQEQPEQPEQPPASATQPLTNPAQAGFGQHGASGYGGQPPPGYGYQQHGGYGGPPGGGYGYPAPPGYGGPPPRRRRGLATAITYIAVAALAATAGGLAVSFADSGSSQPGASSGSSGGSGFGFPGNGSPGASGNANPGAGISSATEHRVETAVEPGIVIINGSLGFSGSDDAGTGMIISKSGLVLTNNHVINQTTGLSARVVGTNTKYQAKWLGYDQGSDIAVLQLEGAHGLPTVPLGDSSKVKVGDPVIGMGNANGAGFPSAVPGTITGVNQTITASDQGGAPAERLTGMLETDADIVSGDSGGPLASTNGKVIGMDTAASTNSVATDTSVGFAIPINKAMTIAHQIISGKSGSGVQIGSTGFVGVLVTGGPTGGQSNQTSPQGQLQQQEQNNRNALPSPSIACITNSGQAGTVPQSIASVPLGTLVLGVICGTPADQVHLIPGDVITRVAGHRVSSPASLMSVLHTFHGGSRISITWVTPTDQTVSKTLTVASAPPS